MPLLGQGVLAIWNGIAPEAEADFLAWHVREHMPERVGLPGFLRGRRYRGEDAQPPYFNFYETAGSEVLSSPSYRERLNAPSDWTRQVVRHFTDTSRTICRVCRSVGAGEGGWIATYRIFSPVDAAVMAVEGGGLLDAMTAASGIVAAHLLQGDEAASQSGSSEKAMRAGPDEVVGWILLIEAVDRASLDRIDRDMGIAARLRAAGAGGEIVRGCYRFQFGLT